MRDPAVRLLSLLSLLQSRPDWTGSELADRLGVSARTVRNDIRRLRELGYPVDAVQGPSGHYRLGSGAALPPLLLDDEEAVAIAIGLRSAAGVSGIEESSARALAKLERSCRTGCAGRWRRSPPRRRTARRTPAPTRPTPRSTRRC